MIKGASYQIIQYVCPLIVFLGAIGAAIPITVVMPLHYSAEARVWIQAQIPNQSSSGDSQSNASLYLPFMTFFNSPILTSSEIIKSAAVAHEAVELLKQRYPGSALPSEGEIVIGISTQAIKDTDILSVKFDYSKPEQAAHILDAIIDGFVKLSTQQSSSSATKERLTLENQLAQARLQLNNVAGKIAVFQKKHSIADMSTDTERLLNQVQTLEDTVHSDEVEIAKKKQEIASLEKALNDTDPGEANQMLVESLQERLSEQHIKLADTTKNLREDHPFVQKIKDDIVRTKQAIAELRQPTSYADWNQIKEQLTYDKQDLHNLERELYENKNYQRQLEGQRQAVPEQVVQWSELQREKELATTTVSDLEKRLNEASLLESIAQGTTNIKVIDRPSPPTLPSGPSKALMVAIGGVMGLILGAVMFIAIRQMNPFIFNITQVLTILPLSIAGVFPLTKTVQPGQIDKLRRAIKKSLDTKKRIVITSPDPQDGKSRLAAALALSFANNGSRVILIDANQDHPDLHTHFGQTVSPGLTEYLISPKTVNPLKVISDNLSLLTCGAQHVSFNLFEQPGVLGLLERLQEEADLIIFDTPAALTSPQYLILIEEPSVLAIALRYKQTRKNSLALLAAQLGDVNLKDALYVLTDAQENNIIVPVAPVPVPAASTSQTTTTQEEQPVW